MDFPSLKTLAVLDMTCSLNKGHSCCGEKEYQKTFDLYFPVNVN